MGKGMCVGMLEGAWESFLRKTSVNKGTELREENALWNKLKMLILAGIQYEKRES